MDSQAGTFDVLLPELQAVASRLWTPTTWQHPGQLAWSSIFADPSSLVSVWDDAAFGWLEAPDWLEVAVDPACPKLIDDVLAWALVRASTPLRAGIAEADTSLVHGFVRHGFAVVDGMFFTQMTLDLAQLVDVPTVAGYSFRSVNPAESGARAACHRAAWSDEATSSVSTERSLRLMDTPPYRPEQDWVAVDGSDDLVASCIVWLDTGTAPVEPVGCAPAHRGRGLAGAVTLAALSAAGEYGADAGLVRLRGGDDYPVPAELYRSIGVRPTARALTLVGPERPGPEGS